VSDVAIKIENLSKQYCLGVVGTGTLSHDLKRWWAVSVMRGEDPYLKIGEANVQDRKGRSQYVWALRDINLEVRQGEVLGIIGRNGAGKSTLLKILSRVTRPTTGTISCRGRIASLLEVGTGFHPEMTGRENIFMNGSIMGMTRAEIKRKFDEIVDFAGVERYIDTPVKRYSSGMTVRLGFAIAAHLEPEILVVDEVLAVGDAEFQKKAVGKMQDVSRQEGRTVLFVSHNMGSIRSLCNQGLLLENGSIEFNGNIEDVVNNYLTGQQTVKTDDLSKRSDRKGNKFFVFTECNIFRNNQKVIEIFSGDSIKIVLKYTLNKIFNANDLILSIVIYDHFNQIVASFPSDELGAKFEKLERGMIQLIIPEVMLRPGTYSISLFSFYKNTSSENYIDAIDEALIFNILPSDYFSSGRLLRKGSYALIKAKYI
jgi:lipopolysaccharide transport system ATP-binding protein